MGNYIIMGGHDGGIGAAVNEFLSEIGHGAAVTDRHLDVRKPDLLRRFFEETPDPFGINLTGIVYCAGINKLDWIGQMGVSGLREAANVHAVNSLGFLAVLDTLVSIRNKVKLRDVELAQPGLSVIAISSDAGIRPLRTSAAYCSSKASLDMMVKVAARELGPHGWRINAVSPGMVSDTGMTKQMDEEIPKIRQWDPDKALTYEMSQEVVPGRVHPEEVAQVVVDVLTGPSHLNGAIIPVNGGR